VCRSVNGMIRVAFAEYLAALHDQTGEGDIVMSAEK
jgi:hypothetical protein